LRVDELLNQHRVAVAVTSLHEVRVWIPSPIEAVLAVIYDLEPPAAPTPHAS
jgi:hypothetical protein